MQSCPGKSSLMGETQPGPREQGLRGRPGPTLESSWRGETVIAKQASIPRKQNCWYRPQSCSQSIAENTEGGGGLPAAGCGVGGFPARTVLHRSASMSPVPLKSWLRLPGSGYGGRKRLLTSFCRRTNRSPGALPPSTPKNPPLPALCLVMCMGETAPARPQDEALARSLPQPQPGSRTARGPQRA